MICQVLEEYRARADCKTSRSADNRPKIMIRCNWHDSYGPEIFDGSVGVRPRRDDDYSSNVYSSMWGPSGNDSISLGSKRERGKSPGSIKVKLNLNSRWGRMNHMQASVNRQIVTPEPYRNCAYSNVVMNVISYYHLIRRYVEQQGNVFEKDYGP